MRHSHFRLGFRDQAFPHAPRSIVSIRTSLTRTQWKDATKGSPQTDSLLRGALVVREKGKDLSSSTTIVRKEEKVNRRAKARTAEKDLDVVKAKGARAKLAKERKENLPSTKEPHPNVTFAWR